MPTGYPEWALNEAVFRIVDVATAPIRLADIRERLAKQGRQPSGKLLAAQLGNLCGHGLIRRVGHGWYQRQPDRPDYW